MKIIDCEQGTAEWTQARLGIPTASCFGRILTAKTRKPAGGAQSYMCELLAERLLGRPLDDVGSDFMLRGTELEESARGFYEIQKDAIETVGFITTDDGAVGYSPDGIVGGGGAVEIKCLSAANHIAAVVAGAPDAKYLPQVQGGLWVSERAWCDVVFYNPDLPSVIYRVGRDEGHIEALASAVIKFNVDLESFSEQLGVARVTLEDRLKASV